MGEGAVVGGGVSEGVIVEARVWMGRFVLVGDGAGLSEAGPGVQAVMSKSSIPADSCLDNMTIFII